jgi:hypothetical protein
MSDHQNYQIVLRFPAGAEQIGAIVGGIMRPK